ncbi:MutT/NUDIX hydrolase [Lymphocystis disease virus 1]|uniref:MutT/NUDIX hydrolase n=1 Tax=Fish lymphocystis disease virus TaxID=36363 RepID=UPI0000161EE8|nr:MutT/NUDIX hydrolase [Lymphocystis disease virus 1]
MLCNCCKFYLKNTNDINTLVNYKQQKAGYILINTEQQVIVVKSCSNKWGFPKGSLEDGESFKDCADRELLEETGIEACKLPNPYKVIKCNNVMYFIVKDVDFNTFLPFDMAKTDVLGIGIVALTCLQVCNRTAITANVKNLLKNFLF